MPRPYAATSGRREGCLREEKQFVILLMDRTDDLLFMGSSSTIKDLPLVHRGSFSPPSRTKHTSVHMGYARKREGHGAATEGPRDKFLIFHALGPRALSALDKRAEALHMALLCPGKIFWWACGISVPCFSLQEHGSFIPSPAQPCCLWPRGRGWPG